MPRHATHGVQAIEDDALLVERLRVQRFLDLIRLIAMLTWTGLALWFRDGSRYRDWEIQLPYIAGYTGVVAIMFVTGLARPKLRLRVIWLAPTMDAVVIAYIQYVSLAASPTPTITVVVTTAIFLLVLGSRRP